MQATISQLYRDRQQVIEFWNPPDKGTKSA